MDFDSIDEKQAFKLGFAAYCADQGLSPEDARAFVKSAEPFTLAGLGTAALAGGAYLGGKAMDLGGQLANNIVPLTKNLTLMGVGIPAAVGLAGGGALGYGAAKLNEPDITPEDIKAQELAETYKRYTDRLKARRAYQQYRAARQTQ